MKKVTLIFFLVHFFIIFTLSVYLTLDTYINQYSEKPKHIPVVGFLKEDVYDNKYFGKYLMIAGINTGYGFYGISVSTEKYFILECYDSSMRLIKSDKYFAFETSNGYSRFKGFASYLVNFISTTDDMKKKAVSGNMPERVKIREKYVDKVFKWIGRNIAQTTPGCVIYKVKLNTILPANIWSKNEDKQLRVFTFKESEYAVQ